MSSLQIGTAQFGNAYGLTNGSIALEPRECWNILDCALSHGVSEVDTSPTYGESLSILSKYRGGTLKVTSKIKIKGLGISKILELIHSQIELLGDCHSLHTILIHDFAELTVSDLNTFGQLVTDFNQVSFGISVYDPWEIERASEYLLGGATIQYPISILNQRFSGVVSSRQFTSFTYVARSLMLQGAIDWESESNPFRNHPSILKLRLVSELLGLNPIELVIMFAKTLNVDSILFGFASEKQLQKFLNVWDSNTYLDIDFSNLQSDDLSLIDPRNW